MNGKQISRKRGRLPGEVAFDRCFLPLIAISVITTAFEIFHGGFTRSSGSLSETDLAAQTPPPIWLPWSTFALGILMAVLWVRALTSLVWAWRDPSSRVLRFSASVLLIPFAFTTCRLLL